MRKSLIALLVVLLIGAGAGAAYWRYIAKPAMDAAASTQAGGRGAQRGPTLVEAAPVRIGPVEITTDAVGSLSSNESVILKPEVTGRVTSINFEEGRPIKAGQVLVELDAEVEKAQLAEAQANIQLASANLDRARELKRSNVGTQRALDEAQAQQLTGTAAVNLAKARLAKLTLTAPFDGMAGLRHVSVGDFVTAGTEIVNLEQIQPLKVDFRIPEVFLRSILQQEGERQIQIVLDSFPGETFTGRVFAINPLVDEQGRAIVVRAQVDNPKLAGSDNLRLRPGLFARVTLALSEEADALWVPEQAIVPQGTSQWVYKVAKGDDGQSVAKFTQVELGHRKEGQVQILKGLAPDDRVVAAGTVKLRDNVLIKLQDAPKVEPVPAPTASGGASAAAG